MRLSAKHGTSWMSIEDCGVAEVVRVSGRYGSIETARMGRGEPIVIVPGMAGGWRLMVPLARELARSHDVVLMGLRGDRSSYGPTSFQKPADHALDLASLITRLRLERPMVMGASYGGAIALEAAARYPGCVGSLALMGVEARFRPSLGSRVVLSALERFQLPRTSPFLNQFFNVLHGCRPEPGPMVNFLAERLWDTDQGVVAARLRGLEGFDLTESLWRVDAPSLVIAGTKDVVVRPTNQRDLAEAIPGASFAAVEGAGHAGFLTHCDVVAHHVARFALAQATSLC